MNCKRHNINNKTIKSFQVKLLLQSKQKYKTTNFFKFTNNCKNQLKYFQFVQKIYYCYGTFCLKIKCHFNYCFISIKFN